MPDSLNAAAAGSNKPVCGCENACLAIGSLRANLLAKKKISTVFCVKTIPTFNINNQNEYETYSIEWQLSQKTIAIDETQGIVAI